MRLLLVSGPTSYGTATCVRHLTRAAVAAGLETTVACPGDGPLRAWALAEGATWQRLELTREASLRDLASLVSLRRLMRRADVVHLHSSKAGALGRLAALTVPGATSTTIFTPHGWSWHVGGRAAPLYRVIERSLCTIGMTVCVSSDEASDGRQVLGRRARPRTIINGVPTERFTALGPRARRSADPLVLVVGRFCEQKGQDLAVRVLAELRDPRVRLRFIGGGDDSEVRALATELGVTAQVEWVGEADPAAHYRAADVVLIPSRYEGLSLAMLEAMASGCAIVASDVAGVGALDSCGVVVPTGDVQALTEATQALLADPLRRSSLGVAARTRAIDNFDIGRYNAAWLATWQETARCRIAPDDPRAREAVS